MAPANPLSFGSMTTAPRRLLLRSFWISLATVLVLAGALWFGGRVWLAQSLMPYEGEVRIDGLIEQVDIHFDARGIPRVYGKTDADVLTALGWLHAGERLFQMELIRRMARGELAELFGPVALEFDVLHRGFGFARRVDEDPPPIDAETSALIDAYLEGINARIQRDQRLPPEFVLLGETPRPWTSEDVLTVAYYQTFYPLTLVQQVRDAYLGITEEFGPEAGIWLHTLSDQGQPTIPSGRMTEASNTWTVAPERSASGQALHASDPHLEFDIAPGLWYAVGLHSDQNLNTVGVTAPGLPFVAMGHNGAIAWAFTVAPVDLFELYRVPRVSDDPDRILGPDGEAGLRTVTESIAVRGRDEPVEQSYSYAPFGKVVEQNEEQALILRWAGFEQPIEPLIRAGLALNRAADFNQFRSAASDMGALSVNWSYSDQAGNIGYVQSTPVPIRSHEQFFQVLDGTNPNYHWQGFHPPEARPWALNPAQGWLANANNLAAGPDWPYALPGFYYQDRIERAAEHLDGSDRHTQSDMTRFQLDQISDRALTWKGWLADIIEQSGRGRLADDMRTWDGDMRVDSDMAGLFARWWGYLPRALFETDDPGRPDWRELRPVTDAWLRAEVEFPELAVRDREEAAAMALEDALRAGARPLGMVQTLHIRHPLAESALLDRWLGLSRGPFAFGGDSASLNAMFGQFRTEPATWRARAGASMRFTLDWDDPERFTLNLALGQSGNPFSPHFDSFLAEFLSGEPWVVPWSEDEVQRNAASHLVLAPPH